MEQQQKFEQWCIVELFGHTKLAGLVSEQNIGGAVLVRVDVPEVQREASTGKMVNGRYEEQKFVETIAAFTRFYGAGAIYSITPTSEEVARAVAQRIASRPIAAFELPTLRALNSPAKSEEPDDHDGADDEESNNEN
jgi:hypothetical protein